ncbi:hypothetical protein KQX54_006346 [Cotesia glomerata]|uniref:Uncharacterized protein n=1 Tax=Cotesia glomerata TaxID=32391 RepID=A0AAV7IIP6_COTGL|nr:hypothetical protein KQX54_006346 [Cotesia glomerata]
MKFHLALTMLNRELLSKLSASSTTLLHRGIKLLAVGSLRRVLMPKGITLMPRSRRRKGMRRAPARPLSLRDAVLSNNALAEFNWLNNCYLCITKSSQNLQIQL